VFSKKYTNSLVGDAASYKPYYRAFLDGSDSNAPKITGTGFNANYASTDAARAVYPMDEYVWIIAARANDMAGADATPLAANFAGLAPQYKWADEATFNANAVTFFAPAPSNIRLAGVGSGKIEAVMPFTLAELFERRKKGLCIL